MGEPIWIRKRKLAGRSKYDARLVVWCKSKKGTEKICSFELSRQKIFSYYDETKLKEVKTKRRQKECISRAERTILVMSEAGQYQNCSGRESRFMLGSQRSYVTTTKKIGCCGQQQGRRAESTNAKYDWTGIEQEYWMGTEIDRLGGYGYRATDTAGVRSNHQGGEMGAGHVNLRGEKQMQQRKVGREEEGSSSNRLELAAFVLTVLCGTPLTKPMLYLYDHQVLLKDANTWAGEGGKATLVQTTDADILREAIKEFGKRTAAGSSDVSGQRECESRRTY